MRRHELSDSEWEKLLPLLPENSGRKAIKGDRNFLNGILWITRTGAGWRDLPERYGKWKTIYNRFNNWATKGAWRDIFEALAIPEEDVAAIMDSTIVRAHQDSCGGQGGAKKTT